MQEAVAIAVRRDRRLHCRVGRARGSICELEPALPAGQQGLVDEVEEIQQRDVRIARDHRDQLRVVRALRRVVEQLHVLGARVEPNLVGPDLGLVSRLVHEQARRPVGRARGPPTGLVEHGLRRAVERIPPRLLETVEVRAARVGPREADRRRVGVRVRMAVDRDVVRDRTRSTARAVRVPDVLREEDRRARHVARRLEVVVAARGKAEADHVDVRIHRLERVVTRRHCRLLHRAGHRVPGRVELRLVEARLVPLVQADDARHLRIARGDHRGELREQLDAVRRVDEGTRLQRVDGEDHLDPARGRLRERAVEECLLRDRRRSGRIPHDGDSVLGHPEVVEGGEKRRAAVVRVLAGVVRDAERRRRRAARQGERRQQARQGRSCRPHTVYLGKCSAKPEPVRGRRPGASRRRTGPGRRPAVPSPPRPRRSPCEPRPRRRTPC